MKRFLGAFLLASGIAVAAGACDDTSGGGTGFYGPSGASCSAYTTCGTCTPVNGCGWCFAPGGGGGACASSPDECVSETGEFTWSWNPSGCPGVDASVAPAPDGGTTTPPTEASTPPAEAGPGASDTGARGSGASDAAAAPGDAGSGDGASQD